jgi:uncharacterized protein YaaQ
MMIVILNDRDAEATLDALVENELRVTRVSSTGGFLRTGNTTLLIGLEEERVDRAIDLIRENCEAPMEVGQRRAMIFVLDVAQHLQI